ncbi:unnamed protein product [Amoebophrya sp. A120]|nr:unnamed protein product [Amoebophrya sp. A120]|eukprot:GSA120T00018302001.1
MNLNGARGFSRSSAPSKRVPSKSRARPAKGTTEEDEKKKAEDGGANKGKKLPIMPPPRPERETAREMYKSRARISRREDESSTEDSRDKKKRKKEKKHRGKSTRGRDRSLRRSRSRFRSKKRTRKDSRNKRLRSPSRQHRRDDTRSRSRGHRVEGRSKSRRRRPSKSKFRDRDRRGKSRAPSKLRDNNKTTSFRHQDIWKRPARSPSRARQAKRSPSRGQADRIKQKEQRHERNLSATGAGRDEDKVSTPNKEAGRSPPARSCVVDKAAPEVEEPFVFLKALDEKLQEKQQEEENARNAIHQPVGNNPFTASAHMSNNPFITSPGEYRPKQDSPVVDVDFGLGTYAAAENNRYATNARNRGSATPSASRLKRAPTPSRPGTAHVVDGAPCRAAGGEKARSPWHHDEHNRNRGHSAIILDDAMEIESVIGFLELSEDENGVVDHRKISVVQEPHSEPETQHQPQDRPNEVVKDSTSSAAPRTNCTDATLTREEERLLFSEGEGRDALNKEARAVEEKLEDGDELSAGGFNVGAIRGTAIGSSSRKGGREMKPKGSKVTFKEDALSQVRCDDEDRRSDRGSKRQSTTGAEVQQELENHLPRQSGELSLNAPWNNTTLATPTIEKASQKVALLSCSTSTHDPSPFSGARSTNGVTKNDDSVLEQHVFGDPEKQDQQDETQTRRLAVQESERGPVEEEHQHVEKGEPESQQAASTAFGVLDTGGDGPGSHQVAQAVTTEVPSAQPPDNINTQAEVDIFEQVQDKRSRYVQHKKERSQLQEWLEAMKETKSLPADVADKMWEMIEQVEKQSSWQDL